MMNKNFKLFVRSDIDLGPKINVYLPASFCLPISIVLSPSPSPSLHAISLNVDIKDEPGYLNYVRDTLVMALFQQMGKHLFAGHHHDVQLLNMARLQKGALRTNHAFVNRRCQQHPLS